MRYPTSRSRGALIVGFQEDGGQELRDSSLTPLQPVEQQVQWGMTCQQAGQDVNAWGQNWNPP